MGESLYIWRELAATRAGLPQPRTVVQAWLGRLRELLDRGGSAPGDCYGLLAGWGRLRRVRPDLLGECDGLELLAQAERRINAGGGELFVGVGTEFRSSPWLAGASQLAAAFDEPAPWELRRREAERLLEELDAAELVAYAAGRLAAAAGRSAGERLAPERLAAKGLAGPERLVAEVAVCGDWLLEHSGLFVSAAEYVQAVGMALRPDLADFDYGLAVTALKYLEVLRATADAEAELGYAAVRPLDVRVARELAARYVGQRRQAAEARFQVLAAGVRQRMQGPVTASAGAESGLEFPQCWEWVSPGGALVARLSIPAAPTPAEAAIVEFIGPDRRPAGQLAGQQVALHGVQAAIDPRGRATLPLAAILEPAEPLVLRVGPDRIEWSLKQSPGNGPSDQARSPATADPGS